MNAKRRPIRENIVKLQRHEKYLHQIRSAGQCDASQSIIRRTLAEFGANKPGTVYFDPTTDDLFKLFSAPIPLIL